MIQARVVVEERQRGEEEPESAVWGSYIFAVLPRTGELLSLLYQDEYQWVAVKRVEHHTVSARPPKEPMPFLPTEPSVNLICEWRGIV